MSGHSTVERVALALDGAHSTQDTLNIFTSIDDTGARARAEKLDQRMAAGNNIGSLPGTPIAVKDLIDQAGRTTSNGSAFYREIPVETAPCVAAMEAAGGVVIGRTGLHEWAFGFSSENPHWGAVRNPWDPNTSPGGSSGGSAAAVAAGIVPIALGTDTGGSVRVPAALCGTYGLKVTHGRIPLDGVFPLVPSIDTVGPLANSIDNLEGAYRAMSGDTEPEPQPSRHRFGVPQPWYEHSPTDDDIATGFQNAVDALVALGHDVHPLEVPDVFPAIQLWNAIAGEVREVHRGFRETNSEYGADVAQRLDDADLVDDSDIEAGHRWQETIRDRFSDAFATVDFLITPSVPVRRKTIGEDLIGGQHFRTVLSYFSAIVNHSLHPALAIPLANSGTPPTSLQVIGPRNSETALIGLGRHLEIDNLTGFTFAPPNSPTTHPG